VASQKRHTADWEAIEREYRAGQLSVREISRQHEVSHVAIAKRAKAEGWVRSLAQRVREEVTSRLVTSEVTSGNAKEAVETAVVRGVEVIRQHRHAIGRGRDLTLRLLDELDAATTNVGELQEMIEEATAGDKTAQRRNAMMRAVELPSRAGVIKDLSAAAKNWVALERQAFNLGDNGGSDEPATKGDVRSALGKLNQGQRDSLRDIATALVGGTAGASQGA
jgi:hypothetical protein